MVTASSSPDPARDAPWLDEPERATWIMLMALMTTLPGTLDARLQRDAGVSLFEYTVLAMLSEQADRSLRMSELAVVANGSLSRLSHVARRLEKRGLLRRAPLPSDGRVTVATLTDTGYDAVCAAAPGHVREVRRIVFDRVAAADLGPLRRVLLDVLEGVHPEAAAAVTRVIG